MILPSSLCSILDFEAYLVAVKRSLEAAILCFSNSDVMCSVLDPEAVPGGSEAEPGGGHLVFF